MTARVAIYATPGTESRYLVARLLRARAESWLGRAVDGSVTDPVLPVGWKRAAIDAITIDARRYGFHGTLKAPFRLAEGMTLNGLARDVDEFAAGTDAVSIPHLTCRLLGDFFALVPGADAPDLHRLADEVVTRFDHYRAPVTQAEIERRSPALLSPRRRELLHAWGYPLVLDEFRFHLTVTDRIPRDQQPAVRAALTSWFASVLDQTIVIDTIALFTESEAGAPFRLHSTHTLRSVRTAPEEPCTAGIDLEGTP